MTSPNSIGNIVSRLQGLKNVRPRRVMPGAEFLEALEEPGTDVRGTAQPMPPLKNLPEEDLGGELTPQSYDVRANSVQNPQQPDYSRLGQALAPASVEPPVSSPVETQQVEAQEGLNPNQAEIDKAISQYPNFDVFSAMGNALKEYISPFGTQAHTYGTQEAPNRQIVENAQMKAQGINPQEQAQAQQMQEAQFQAKIDEAQQNPMAHIVYGATDRAANMPELQAEFQQITGQDFTQQIKDETARYEKVLSDLESNNEAEMAGYDEQMNRIKERIESNSATDMDKYFVGLALLMPVLLGAIYGKGAALGALGGGAQGIANVLGNRMKNVREDEELLADIGKLRGQNELRKGEIELEKLKIPQEVRKNLPKDEQEFLKGKNAVTWTDPNTGEQMTGVQIKPGLVARPEFITDATELKEMRKEAIDIGQAMVPTKDINKLTKDIIYLSDTLDDNGKNLIGDAFKSAIAGKNPGLATKFGKEIEFEGRKVNSMVALEHKLSLLADAYRQAKGMQAFTKTVKGHFDQLFRNPEASFQSYKDTIDQMLYTRSLLQDRIVNMADASGFAPEFVMKEIGEENRDLYNKLNTKEAENYSDKLLR